MTNEEKIISFYEDMANQFQKDPENARIFFTEAITLLLTNPASERNVKILEILLHTSLVYKTDEMGEKCSSPFEALDTSCYMELLKDKLVIQEAILIGNLNNQIHSQQVNTTTPFVNAKDPEIVKCCKTLYGLDKIIRTGWIKRNVQQNYQESDIIHTVQMFALACAYSYLYHPKLNLLRIYEMILIHEVGEILIGDITEGTKECLTKHELERKAVVEIFGPLKNADYYIGLWDEFEDRETEEAQFVYDLDKLDPILKAKYLDAQLDRNDLFSDFYSYEENRHTFDQSLLKSLFNSLK